MNMKTNKIIFSLFIFASLNTAFAQSSELEKKLDALNIPDDKVTTVLSEDQLYVVNDRYSSLRNRHEFTLMGANNFTADSHLSTQSAGLSYRYHINAKWSLGARYNRFSNKLTQAGQTLFDSQKILPDTDYAYNSKELFVNYNTIYGKLRFTEDTVVYFDQYVSLGGGKIKLSSGSKNLMFADLGFAFWMGKHMSARFGVKNDFYTQSQRSGERNIFNANGYLEFGYLFGEGDRG